MKIYNLLLSIVLLIIPIAAYPQTYTKTVLLQHFSVKVPEKIIQKRDFAALQNILQKEAKSHYHSNFGLRYGTFQIKGKASLLWIYNNSNIHNGKVIILNSLLETIYLRTDMGCIYDVEFKDLLKNGENVLMITHGAGGTGHYEQITDLIVFRGGLPTLITSVLKKANYHNELQFFVGDKYQISEEDKNALESIECTSNLINITNVAGKKQLAVDVATTAKVDEKKLTKNATKKMQAMLKKEFNLDINIPKTTRGAIIENLEIPVISIYPSTCASIVYSGYAWPTLSLPKK